MDRKLDRDWEKDNIVSSTLERGWSLNERVIKPALVVVNKNN